MEISLNFKFLAPEPTTPLPLRSLLTRREEPPTSSALPCALACPRLLDLDPEATTSLALSLTCPGTQILDLNLMPTSERVSRELFN
jgi:hypothetical protein